MNTRNHSLRRVFCLLLAVLISALSVPALAAGASSQEAQLYRLLSEDRAARGLYALTLDEELCRMARLRTRDMLDNNYCGHVLAHLRHRAQSTPSTSTAYPISTPPRTWAEAATSRIQTPPS